MEPTFPEFKPGKKGLSDNGDLVDSMGETIWCTDWVMVKN